MIEEGVRLIGNVVLGKDVSIAAPAELMAKDSSIVIGDGCDIAAFVTISTADSHMRCIGALGSVNPGVLDVVERREILIGNCVFIGTGAVILGGCEIGDGSVIGAGVVLKGAKIPPQSRVRVPAPIVDVGYYDREKQGTIWGRWW